MSDRKPARASAPASGTQQVSQQVSARTALAGEPLAGQHVL